DRPLRRDAVAMPVLFKILLAQTEQRRAKKLRVPADVIAEARTNLAALLVEHDLGRVVFERTFVAPVLLLARQERPTLQHENPLPTRRKPTEQRPAARARADDNYVV